MEEGETVDFNLYNRTGDSILLLNFRHYKGVDSILIGENDLFNDYNVETTGSASHAPLAFSDSLRIIINDSLSNIFYPDQRNDTLHKNPFCLNFYELVDKSYDHHFHRWVYEYSILETDF